MGYEIVIHSEFSEMLTCSICMQLASNPQTSSCGHYFCKICVGSVIKKDECPNCKTATLFVDVQDVGLLRKYNNIKIKCPLNPEKCPWKGTVVEVSKHVDSKQCEYAEEQCEFCNLKCIKKEIKDHQQTCEKAFQQCDNIKYGCKMLIHNHKKSHHLLHDCLFMPMLCGYNVFGCTYFEFIPRVVKKEESKDEKIVSQDSQDKKDQKTKKESNDIHPQQQQQQQQQQPDNNCEYSVAFKKHLVDFATQHMDMILKGRSRFDQKMAKSHQTNKNDINQIMGLAYPNSVIYSEKYRLDSFEIISAINVVNTGLSQDKDVYDVHEIYENNKKHLMCYSWQCISSEEGKERYKQIVNLRANIDKKYADEKCTCESKKLVDNFQIGMLVDARDREQYWCEAMVKNIDLVCGKVSIHFIGWASWRTDEIFDTLRQQTDIAPLHSITQPSMIYQKYIDCFSSLPISKPSVHLQNKHCILPIAEKKL